MGRQKEKESDIHTHPLTHTQTHTHHTHTQPTWYSNPGSKHQHLFVCLFGWSFVCLACFWTVVVNRTVSLLVPVVRCVYGGDDQAVVVGDGVRTLLLRLLLPVVGAPPAAPPSLRHSAGRSADSLPPPGGAHVLVSQPQELQSLTSGPDTGGSVGSGDGAQQDRTEQ